MDRAMPLLRNVLCGRRHFALIAATLLLLDSALTFLIIERVPYTEIDWVAYMQEVKGFQSGERDYAELRGDTGPLVYPAGFVYVFSALRDLTGGGRELRSAQFAFAALRAATLAVVFRIYYESERVPPFALVLITLSKRLHSIYVLRLFNDPVAMLPLYGCILASNHGKWTLASALFSLALSIKMNILLFFPALGLLLYKATGLRRTARNLAVILMVQLILGLPFLLSNPWSYVQRSFQFSRVFDYTWTVNWRFLSKDVFLSKSLAGILLACHVLSLMTFLFGRWCRTESGVFTVLRRGFRFSSPYKITARHVCDLMFTANFLGIVFARSLHYQFYSWYAHSIPYLLWSAPHPIPIKLALFVAIEACWNVYPSTSFSSLTLIACHGVLIVGIWSGRAGILEPRLPRRKGKLA